MNRLGLCTSIYWRTQDTNRASTNEIYLELIVSEALEYQMYLEDLQDYIMQ